jgi:ferritin-like metal-binding protein YciE
MNSAEQKIVQYLNEAHASEVALVSVLRSQISMAPGGSYRDGLEKHLEETRDHAERIQQRLDELGEGASPLQAVVGFTETMIGQGLALAKAPFDLMRGSGDEEKTLKNAKDACATEALEIATYTALERLASRVGDSQTARLAASIRGDEERMLQRLTSEISELTDAVVGADIAETDIVEPPAPSAATSRTRQRARQTRQTRRATRTRSTTTTRQRPTAPRRAHEPREPWPGYDELTVDRIDAVLRDGDDQLAREVAAYERAHQRRPAVLQRALAPVPQIIGR